MSVNGGGAMWYKRLIQANSAVQMLSGNNTQFKTVDLLMEL